MALSSHSRRPPSSFCFLDFFSLCRNQIPCIEKKKKIYTKYRGNFLKLAPRHFETHAEILPLVTDGVEVTSLFIGLFLLLPFVPAFSISVWTVRKRFNV